jgi:NCS1 family nucleobase:cation symporter-1
MSDSEILHADGRVELRAPDELKASPLFNHDLAPVSVADRTWNTWDYAALWVSMAHCIPTYTLASGMIAAGMAWWQALTIILLGNLIVLVPILLNSHPGTKYGIPFPVFARAAYGTYGANMPALLRALVACGWFGINAWFGGMALQTFFVTLWPGWATALGTVHGEPGTMWISFLLFWGLNVLVIFKGMDVLRRVERWAAPYVLVMTALLVGWAIWRAGGLGPILSRTSFDESVAHTTFWAVAIPALTGTIAFWSTLSLNMPDFTRFGRSQKEQVVGQAVALPSTMTVFAAMGIVITSASAVIYGSPVWNPIDLAGHFSSRIIVAVATFTAVIATLAVNIAANVVSPANDFANAFPKKINFKRGGLITGLIGIAMMPWELVKDSHRYLDGWLGGYGGALGTVAGVLIVDYWLIRKTRLDLKSLYSTDGAYRYTNGWNRAAVVATVGGMMVAVPGAFFDGMKVLYQWSWFVGFLVAGLLYWLQMRTSAPPRD